MATSKEDVSLMHSHLKTSLAWFIGIIVISTIVLVLSLFSNATYSSTRNGTYTKNTKNVFAVGTPVPLPSPTQANGPYKVKGNAILDAQGQRYLFHGVARDGFEYACQGAGPLDSQSLSYMGPGMNTSSATYWDSNTVRLPLSEEFWLYGNTKLKPSQDNVCTASQYQAQVKQVVDNLTSLKLNVILDLHFTDAGGQWYENGGSQWSMPDSDSVSFWQQVAPLYSSYPNVLFELFNEPHPNSWKCWLETCSISNDNDGQGHTVSAPYTSPGMQVLADTVHASGAQNIVIVGGINYGYDLSMLGKTDSASITYIVKGLNIAYSTHPYPYAGKLAANWNADFGLSSATYPVLSTESGQYCQTGYLNQLLPYFDQHHIGWIGWAWLVDPKGCNFPTLIQDYQGTPFAGTGQFVYQYLRSYTLSLSTPTPIPTSVPSPTSTSVPTPTPTSIPVPTPTASPTGPPGLPPTGSDPNRKT